jgi:hypothetical protein
MKKIKLSVASILLSGMCFAQTEKVIIERIDHLEVINTLEDMIGWIVEDVANGYITDTLVADTYIDNLEEVLFRVKNRTILIENED